MTEKITRLKQTWEDQYLLLLTQDLYKIPILQEVRKIEELEWMTPWYSDHAISVWLELIKYSIGYHQFLVQENYGSYISYNMPWTFIYKPLTGYLQSCYASWDVEEVKNILTYLTNSYVPDVSDKSLDFLVEGFIDGREFDDRVFRERIMGDFPEGRLKDYIKNRFQDIYLMNNISE